MKIAVVYESTRVAHEEDVLGRVPCSARHHVRPLTSTRLDEFTAEAARFLESGGA